MWAITAIKRWIWTSTMLQHEYHNRSLILQLYNVKNKNKLNNIHSRQNHNSPAGTVLCQHRHNLYIKKRYQEYNHTISK